MLIGLKDNITSKFSQWRQTHFKGDNFLYVAALFVGLLSGAAAALLKTMIDLVTGFVFGHFDMHSGNLWFFILPILGIFIAAAWTRYVTRRPMDHASDRITASVAAGQNNLSPRLILGPVITCSITLGMGGSAGGEDPICYTGAAIGSNVGKAFRASSEQLGQLMGCGAAAGIAGIFMAPIGGVMFAIEVLKMKQSLTTIYSVIISSLVAALTCYILMGCHSDVTFMPDMRFDTHLIPFVALCGLVCGIYSIYYRSVMQRCRKRFARFNNMWVKAAIGGVLLSVFLYFFPSLYGEGYKTIARLMADEPMTVVYYGPFYSAHITDIVLMLVLGGSLMLKPFATSATNDSGGVGGGFTPTFFAGGIAGFLFAFCLNYFLHLDLPLALFTFFGMSAVMAGAVKAPLMAAFIAAEMTGMYGFILPLTIAAAISYCLILLYDYLRGSKTLHKVVQTEVSTK